MPQGDKMNKDFRTSTKKSKYYASGYCTTTYVVGETRRKVVKAIKDYCNTNGYVFNSRKRINVTEDGTRACTMVWFSPSGCFRMSVFCNLDTLEVK